MIRALLQEGGNSSDIAKKVGRSRGAGYNALKNLNRNRNNSTIGRPSKMTKKTARLILRAAARGVDIKRAAKRLCKGD